MRIPMRPTLPAVLLLGAACLLRAQTTTPPAAWKPVLDRLEATGVVPLSEWRFHADLAHATRDEIRTHAQQIVERWQADRRRELVGQALSLARSNGRGVTGLRRVLRSLELGEVQTLLLGENLQAHAVECSGCGHLDAHLVNLCPVCGRTTEEMVDVGEAILPWVIRREIETFYVKDDPEFDKVGNIAALLRYRSEKVQPLSASVADELGRAGAAYPGRLRRFASR